MAKTIITIGREYCTGGNYIAEDVANALGIKLYDKELITMAAKHSGLSEEAVAASEKRRTHSLLYSLYTMGNELPLGDQVFILQSRIIKQLAEEGPCVILGRCGDYVLRERKDVLRVFIYAPVEWRRELAKTDPLVKAHDEKGIKEEIEKTDRNRAAYYNYYTQNRWGDAHNYDLAINAALGRETCVKMILDAVAAKEKTMASDPRRAGRPKKQCCFVGRVLLCSAHVLGNGIALLFKHKPSSIIQRQKEKSWKTNSSIFPNPKISWAPWMSTRC